MTVENSERLCLQCCGSMEGKSPRAKYCQRKCQEIAYARHRAQRPPEKRDRTHLRDKNGRQYCGVFGFLLYKTDDLAEVDCEHCLSKLARMKD